MINRIAANLDGLLSIGPALPPADDRAKLAQAFTLGMLRARFDHELQPALRAAARSHLQFAKDAARAGAVYATFAGHGLDIPAPASLMVAAADLAVLARTYVQAGLVSATDPVLDGIDLSA